MTSASQREFSQDGRHLLLSETAEEGPRFTFQYLPNTNLVTAKFTQNDDNILLREFFEYDDCCNLIRHISDDGGSENQHDLARFFRRKIINYMLREEAPFLHMCEWVEEKYLDEGKERLLKKRHLIYGDYGYVCQEDVYDAV